MAKLKSRFQMVIGSRTHPAAFVKGEDGALDVEVLGHFFPYIHTDDDRQCILHYGSDAEHRVIHQLEQHFGVKSAGTAFYFETSPENAITVAADYFAVQEAKNWN